MQSLFSEAFLTTPLWNLRMEPYLETNIALWLAKRELSLEAAVNASSSTHLLVIGTLALALVLSPWEQQWDRRYVSALVQLMLLWGK